MSVHQSVGQHGVDISRVSSISSVISMMRCFRLSADQACHPHQVPESALLQSGQDAAEPQHLYDSAHGPDSHLHRGGSSVLCEQIHFDENGEAITIYSDEWKAAPDVARYNFDDFSSSFASVFQVITTENWNDILYNVWRVMGPGGIIFPMSLVLGGTFIL